LVSQVKIDEIDVKILKALLKDARTSFTDIARDCGVSTAAIVERFYKLKRFGVIAGSSIRVDLEKFGYKFRLLIDVNIDGGYESQIVENCKKMIDSFSCYQVIGKYDLHAVVYIKSFDEIEQIRNMIKRQKGVRRVGLTAAYEGGVFPENLLIQPSETSEDG